MTKKATVGADGPLVLTENKIARTSDCFRAGNTLYLCGQAAVGVPRSDDARADMYTQTSRSITQIAEILAAYDVNLTAVASVSVAITDAELFDAFNQAYAAAFGDHLPARTTVVSQLVLEDLLVEITAVAIIPE